MTHPSLALLTAATLVACNAGDGDATFGSNGSQAADPGSTGGSSGTPPAVSSSGELPTTGGEAEGEGSADDTTAPDPSTTSSTTDTPGTSTGDELSLGDCSMWATPMDFHAHVNAERQSYAEHQRWKGLPWVGEGHTNVTFPLTFTWDEALAAQAQTEAEALVVSASPAGMMETGGNGLCTSDPMWFDGLNTANWRLSLFENANSFIKPSESCPEPFALIPQNPDARMGLFYHDFGGDGPAISRLGVGAAFDADCEVWWVLQFGP